LGDLVRVKKHDYNGDIFYQYGVVVGDQEECQLQLFPYVMVYIFETALTAKEYPNALEVISSIEL
jgi:hypothetical protein